MHFIGNKEQGLYAELQFMVDAYAHGIVCARPQMEQKFDLYAEGITGVKKVQVKCTQRLTKVNNYKFTISYGSGYKEMDEAKIQVQGIGMYDDKTLKKKNLA